MTHTDHLRRRLASGSPLLVPGGGTPLEALLARQAGFDTFYVSGYAAAAWRHGLPDIGLLGIRDTIDALGAVARVTDASLIVDADTGYGDVIAVSANVRELESIGAAAIQIEDQDWPKKCGHMDGKTVIPRDDAVRKVAAAVAARENPQTLIIARTDALAPLGIDSAIDRAKAFVDAGADMTFVDAPRSLDDLRRIAAEVPGPAMANMSEGGKTPPLALGELGALGFDLVIYPTSALRIATAVLGAFFRELRESGTSNPWRDRMHGLDELNEVVGLSAFLEIDRRFADGEYAPTSSS